MEVFGVNVLGLITNPAGAIGAAVTGLLVFQGWNVLKSIFKPAAYVAKLYDLADTAIERIDNSIIDKIRNKKIKKDIQKDLKEVLLNRKEKISVLIDRILFL